MSKDEEHIALAAVVLFVLWMMTRSSSLPSTPYGTTYTATSGGLLGSLTNFLNGAGNLFRGIGGTPPAAATTTSSIVAGDHTGTPGPDDLAPVDFG